MTVGYQVQANQEQLKAAIQLFEFIGGNSTDAIRVAINRSGPKIRTKSSAAIRKQVRLKAGYVNERLKFDRATNRKLDGRISTPSRGMLLSRFSTDTMVANDSIRWMSPPPVPARGIRVKVKPSGTAKVVQGDSDTEGKPFYMVLSQSRALGIVARRKGSRKVKVFHGPSMSQVFNDVRDDVLPEASEVYTEELADAMRYLLSKRKPRE